MKEVTFELCLEDGGVFPTGSMDGGGGCKKAMSSKKEQSVERAQ